ncbi:endolytic transglycosylase MltG [Maritalea sp.]|uniref:endolytic transglycosylase MltG n=1 Tax=Maritalea sp. TaxID=2003361 RepID=UPI003EF1FC73
MADSKRGKKRKKQNGVVQTLNAFLTLIVIGLVAAVALVYYGVTEFNKPGQISTETVFVVPEGAGLNVVAKKLEDERVINNMYVFRFGAVASDADAGLKRGEYLLPANASMKQILDTLIEGRPIQYTVTVPEGFTSWQTVERLRSAQNLTGELDEVPAEGSLLPNTYSFERGSSRADVIVQMKEAHDKVVADIWATRVEGLPIKTVEEFVILASIVEKETGVASERPEVAAVFVNRLNKGMRLQSDPTIIYGITKGEGPLGRGLKRSEIDTKTDYNTYQIDGLPAGPISNPGVESLKAVANPAQTDALYFVADGTGGHAFAPTYEQHQKNVAAWRKIEKERQQAADAEAEAAKDALEAEQSDKSEPSN